MITGGAASGVVPVDQRLGARAWPLRRQHQVDDRLDDLDGRGERGWLRSGDAATGQYAQPVVHDNLGSTATGVITAASASNDGS